MVVGIKGLQNFIEGKEKNDILNAEQDNERSHVAITPIPAVVEWSSGGEHFP